MVYLFKSIANVDKIGMLNQLQFATWATGPRKSWAGIIFLIFADRVAIDISFAGGGEVESLQVCMHPVTWAPRK